MFAVELSYSVTSLLYCFLFYTMPVQHWLLHWVFHPKSCPSSSVIIYYQSSISIIINRRCHQLLNYMRYVFGFPKYVCNQLHLLYLNPPPPPVANKSVWVYIWIYLLKVRTLHLHIIDYIPHFIRRLQLN